MPVWLVRGEMRGGAPLSERLEAPSRAGALAELERRGIAPHGIVAETTGRLRRPARPPSRAERMALYGELGALLAAHVPVVDALRSLVSGAASARLRLAAGRLEDAVREGRDLSQGLADIGAPAAETSAVGAGETAGDPGRALTRLADTLARRERVARALSGALIYPAVLLAVTVVSLGVILLGVVPSLAPLIAGPGREPDLAARLLLGASAGLAGHWDLLLGTALAAAAGVPAALRSAALRRLAERVVLSLPQIGPALREAETAAALRSAGDLIGTGAPVPDAVELAAAASRLSGIRADMTGVAADLRRGIALDGALARCRSLAPGTAGLVAIGLRTGRLAPMLDTAAERLERAAETRIARLLAVLPAALTLLLGTLVGGLSAVVLSAILGANDAAF